MAKTSRVGECLEWTAGTNSEGYGYFKDGGKDWRATRWIFQHDHGYLPPVVMHTCDNPACVELRHLIPGTQADNMADKMTKGRHRWHNPPRRLSVTDVRVIRGRVARGEATQAALAREYGVSPSHISRIVRHETRTQEG